MSELEREITEALDSICRKLNRGDVGNFQASLGLFSTQNVPEHAEEETVKRIFGASTKPVFFMLSSFEEMTSQFRIALAGRVTMGLIQIGNITLLKSAQRILHKFWRN